MSADYIVSSMYDNVLRRSLRNTRKSRRMMSSIKWAF
jgi:hypothetical protein